ncbi:MULTISPECIES: RagB/SusD family nutrient uptake outer membrane protein [unclassified Flavobacterium]|uniref:RagB/SusD family nutrient uptake outer membrane protein n=1 Tax=unclassified Flavobacterium TaxID=196869 RepID=UPI003F916FE7
MRKIKITLSLLVILGLSSSCDDFLSEIPDNRTQLDTPDKISEILVNAYPQANYMEFAETMTDNVFDSGDLTLTTTKNSQNYNWEMQEDINQDTPSDYWDACYSAIAHANQALDAIDKLGNPTNLNPQKGEALLARAYSHFMLVNLFSQRYNPSTAKTDLGIPYVLKPEQELIKKYTRNSVEEVYSYLKADIEKGLTLVTSDYQQPKYHFNKAAANAFASRFYAIIGEWDKVIAVSNDLGNKPIGQLRNYQSYLDVDFNTGMRKYSQESENTNLLIVSASSIYSRSFYSNRFQLTGADRDVLFGASTNLANKGYLYRPLSYNGQITIFVPKFVEYFKYTNANAGIGQPYDALVLLSNDELFLNRIEAHIMTNQFALAIEEMDYFLSIRISGYNAATDKVTESKIVAKYPVIDNEYTPFYSLTPIQKSYIKAVAEMRRREFIHEGLRWLDIKRFALQVTHKVYNQPDKILAKDDLRKAIQLPLHVTNTGVEKNPR